MAETVLELPLWAPPLVAFGISLCTVLAGISGAFLLVPLQLSVLGAAPSISATTHLYNVIATPGGIASYWREGRMVWPLAGILVAGTLPGVFVGALVRVHWLRDPVPFKLFVAGVLAWIGLRLLRDLIGRAGGAGEAAEAVFREALEQCDGRADRPPRAGPGRVEDGALCFEFCGQQYRVALGSALAWSAVVGIVGGIYGIGGGSMIAPFLVSVFGIPVYVAAGPAVLSTFATSAAGVAAFHLLAPLQPGVAVAPDWTLGLLLGAGGLVGMFVGARLQKHVPARLIRWFLAVLVVGLAIRYALEAAGIG